MNPERQWREALKPGDHVVVHSGRTSLDRAAKVVSVTPTQIVLDTQERFYKKNGERRGDGSGFFHTFIMEATPERVKALRVARARRLLAEQDWSTVPDATILLLRGWLKATANGTINGTVATLTIEAESVWLVWLHDMVLGCYASEAHAQARAQVYRDDIQHRKYNWRASPGGRRWHCMEVARLEVEEVRVQS